METSQYTSTQNDATISELERTIHGAARAAGEYLRSRMFDFGCIEWKGIDDPVTVCDKAAEKMIEKDITARFHADFFGEEYGIRKNGADITIYIDPIDGTKSFTKGELLSTISIAAEYKGELCIGCVYDFTRCIMYYANPSGAFMEHENMKGEKRTFSLPLDNHKGYSKKIVLATEPGYHKERLKDIPEMKLHQQSGSIALSMAQTAAGVYDGMIRDAYGKKDDTMLISDIAAGYYILRQAGLLVKNFDGTDYDFKKAGRPFIAARPADYELIARE